MTNGFRFHAKLSSGRGGERGGGGLKQDAAFSQQEAISHDMGQEITVTCHTGIDGWRERELQDLGLHTLITTMACYRNKGPLFLLQNCFDIQIMNTDGLLLCFI